MGDFSKSTITISGEALENRAKQLQKAIKFDRVVTGDGWLLKEGQDLASLTELIHDVQDYELGSANTLVNNQTTLRFTIDSSQVKQTYQLREVGVVAYIEDDPTTLTLFCVANAGDTADTIVPSHDGSSATRDQYTIVLKASRKAKMTAKIVIEDQIPLHADTHLSDGVDPIPTVTSVRDGLAPVGPNDPNLVLVGSNPPHWRTVPLADRTTPGGIPPLDGYPKHYLAGNGRWYRTTPFLVHDTKLYVDPDNSEVWPRFSTLARALEYLSGENISAGVTVTVVLADGTHKIDDVIKFDHPQAEQVKIVGASPKQRIAFTEIKEDGDDLILRVESVKGLSVGMSIIIQGEGQFWNYHPGGHTIKHIEYPHVRVSRSLRNQPPWYGEHKGLSANLFFYRTKVDCPNSGLSLPNGLGHLSHMSMHGHWVPSLITSDEPVFEHIGVSTYGRAFFSDLITSGFGRGINVRYHHFDLNFVTAYECGDGILVDIGSSVTSTGNVYCNGNLMTGLGLHQSNGHLGGSWDYEYGGKTFLRGNGFGLTCRSDSHIWLDDVTAQFNYMAGIQALEHGGITVGRWKAGCWINANTIDLFAADGGFIRGRSHGGYLGGCNPSNRMVGNDNAYIAIDNN